MDRRWGFHEKSLKQNKHHNIHLQHAWNKYGESCFRFKVLKETKEINQFANEQKYIDEYLNSSIEIYNICTDVYNPQLRLSVKRICQNIKKGIPCGSQFDAVYNQQKYCPSCSKLRREQYLKKNPTVRNAVIYITTALIDSETNNMICGFLDIDEGEQCRNNDLIIFNEKWNGSNFEDESVEHEGNVIYD